ncbi:iron-sulfur cluster carrier protein ApbC [Candidatus Foliamicus sp.]
MTDTRIVAKLEDSILAVAAPFGDLSLAEAGVRVRVADGGESAELIVGFPCEGFKQSIVQRVIESSGLKEITVRTEIAAHAVPPQVQRLEQVRNIIAVASAKGGVGKSTVAANLAAALALDGARTGILDADIYGPSVPRMLGLEGERPRSTDGKSFEPLRAHGLQASSIGFLVDTRSPVVWRGPMVTQALMQLLGQTRWKDLDYLVVDMPPGTGDIQLTLSQRVPLAGAVVVTTPQELAVADARKGIAMFGKVNVPVLGVVENMSAYVCPHCGHEDLLFGEGGGARLAEEFDVPLLARLPLSSGVRAATDDGRLVAPGEPDAGGDYRALSRAMAIRLAGRARGARTAFPKIVVE